MLAMLVSYLVNDSGTWPPPILSRSTDPDPRDQRPRRYKFMSDVTRQTRVLAIGYWQLAVENL